MPPGVSDAASRRRARASSTAPVLSTRRSCSSGSRPGFTRIARGRRSPAARASSSNGSSRASGSRSQTSTPRPSLKCRPPGNRDPLPDEVSACEPYLYRQLELVRPRVVASLGSFATTLLAGRALGITRVHGQEHEVTIGARTLLLYPLYHPVAALYTPSMLEVLERDVARLPAAARARRAPTERARPRTRLASRRRRVRDRFSSVSSERRAGARARDSVGGRDREARRAARTAVCAGRRRARLRGARRGQDDLRPRRLSRARRHGARDEPDVHHRPPLHGGTVDVSHLDLYRFRGSAEEEWGDLEPYFDDAVVFVEWPEAGGSGCRRRGPASASTTSRPDSPASAVDAGDASLLQGAGGDVLILAFDTATDVATSALVDGRRGARASASSVARTLLEDVDALLRQASARPADLDALAVGTGPGSFTSTRIGLAVARGLALALDSPARASRRSMRWRPARARRVPGDRRAAGGGVRPGPSRRRPRTRRRRGAGSASATAPCATATVLEARGASSRRRRSASRRRAPHPRASRAGSSGRSTRSSRSTFARPTPRRWRASSRSSSCGASTSTTSTRSRRSSGSRIRTPWSRSMFASELAKPSSLSLRRGRRDGALVGYLVLSRYVDAWHVMNVAVAPEQRRPGVAPRLLLDSCFDVTRDDAHRGYTLEVRVSTSARSGSTSASASSREACAAATTPTTARTR